MATQEEAKQLQDEFIALLKGEGFTFHKCSSNCIQLLQRLLIDHPETPISLIDDNDLSVSVLSQIRYQFDLLSFVSPCILYAKSFFRIIEQETWFGMIDFHQIWKKMTRLRV